MRTRDVIGKLTARAGELALLEQQRLMDTFASQIALVLERVHYVAITQDALVNMDSERSRNSPFSAISYDLRTRLTAMVGLTSVLAEQVTPAESPAQQAVDMIGAIHEEVLHMAGLVNNPLDMARLQESGERLNQ